MENKPTCPICKSQLSEEIRTESKVLTEKYLFNCPRCGKYILNDTVLGHLPNLLSNPEEIILLSHSIHHMQRDNYAPEFDTSLLREVFNKQLPGLVEQGNNLILWLGDSTNAGDRVFKNIEIYQTIMGAKTEMGTFFVIHYLQDSKLVEFTPADSPEQGLMLTMLGWEYCEKLKRGAIMSRKAFMAMKFGDEDLDFVFENYLKPAVKSTGYNLYRLDEQMQAGPIDDKLRVEIRTSRFMIADLTHGNQGAYWEAGFAEGLGKPVIYTCEKNKFDSQSTHFDTNHHLTIKWDKENPDDAARKLKATIRATLPDEAILIDT